MSIYNLILKRRSIRRFKRRKIEFKILKKILNSARLAPSASNLQPLEFLLVNKRESKKKMFPLFKWAGYIPNFEQKENERPEAYIIILVNEKIRSAKDSKYDVAFAAENAILTALSFGISSCCIGSINRKKTRRIFRIPKNYSIEIVIVFGYGKERSKIEKWKGDVKYWEDEKGFHVPKRNLKDIVHKNKW